MRRAAVLIGSGPNGLSAAIALAAAGRPVTVLEAASRPGGAVASEELTLPGFRHDTFSAVYPAAVASPVFARLPLELHGLRWIHPQVCCAHPLPDGRGAALYRELDRTAASLDSFHPGDGEAWCRFIGPLLRRFGALRDTLLGGFPPWRGPARLAAGLRPPGLAGLARVLLMPAQALAHELFAAPANRAWLYGSAMHGDVPLTASGSAIPAVYLNLLGHAVGWPSPQGGAARLAGALVDHLLALGGAVRTDAEVVEILAAAGRVAGVRLAGGETVESSLVLADVMPAALAGLAGSSLPDRYRQRLLGYRPGPSTVKLDWALSAPIPWSFPAAREAGTVHVGGDEPDMLAAGAFAGGLPERPFLLVGQQSLADPTRAPAGRHTAWAYTHGPQGTDWPSELERHSERMEAQIERFAPGFRQLILARHALGPQDLERRNRNLVGGDVGGGSYALDQALFRPFPRRSPYGTPLRGLYLCSAATFPGGGVHGVPGYAAARLALVRARLALR